MEKLVGIILGIISAVAYGTNPLFGVKLLRDGVSVDAMLFWRFAGAALLLAPAAYCAAGNLKISARDIPALATLGALFAVSAHSLFAAFEIIPAGIASTMLFLYPVFVALIMSIFFGEKPKATTIIAIIMSLAGVAFLYADDANFEGLNIKGALLVIISALTYAFYIVIVKVSRVSAMDGVKLAFYAIVFAAFAAFAKCALDGNLSLPQNSFETLNAFGLVVFPTALSIVAISYSIKYAGATIAALLGAFEPVTAVSISSALLGEKFSLYIGIGIALIMSATIIITLSASQSAFRRGMQKNSA